MDESRVEAQVGNVEVAVVCPRGITLDEGHAVEARRLAAVGRVRVEVGGNLAAALGICVRAQPRVLVEVGQVEPVVVDGNRHGPVVHG